MVSPAKHKDMKRIIYSYLLVLIVSLTDEKNFSILHHHRDTALQRLIRARTTSHKLLKLLNQVTDNNLSTMLKSKIIILSFLIPGFTRPFHDNYKDVNIRYEPVKLTAAEKQELRNSLDKLHPRYDPKVKMLSKTLTGYNYHTTRRQGFTIKQKP